MLRVAIGADHAGFALKRALVEWLGASGYDVVDLGTQSDEPVDYPDYAEAVALAVREGRVERGVLICGSGVGACVAANKAPGVRAGLCHDLYSARQGVEHDDINVLVLGARVIGAELARQLVETYLSSRFTGEARHRRRLEKVTALERRFASPRSDGPGETRSATGK